MGGVTNTEAQRPRNTACDKRMQPVTGEGWCGCTSQCSGSAFILPFPDPFFCDNVEVISLGMTSFKSVNYVVMTSYSGSGSEMKYIHTAGSGFENLFARTQQALHCQRHSIYNGNTYTFPGLKQSPPKMDKITETQG